MFLNFLVFLLFLEIFFIFLFLISIWLKKKFMHIMAYKSYRKNAGRCSTLLSTLQALRMNLTKGLHSDTKSVFGQIQNVSPVCGTSLSKFYSSWSCGTTWKPGHLKVLIQILQVVVGLDSRVAIINTIQKILVWVLEACSSIYDKYPRFLPDLQGQSGIIVIKGSFWSIFSTHLNKYEQSCNAMPNCFWLITLEKLFH